MVALFLALASYLTAFLLFTVKLFAPERVKNLPYAFLTAGVVFYALALFERFAEYGTFPIGDVYGTLSFIGNLSVIIFVFVAKRYAFELLGTVVSFMAFLTTMFLIPSRRLGFSDPLFIVHLVTAVVSYAFIIFAGLASFSKLVLERRLKKKASTPPLAPYKFLMQMEKFFIVGGFLGLTLTLVFGSLWAKDYLGTHWVQDEKLVITLVLWLFYAFLSHAYALKLVKPSQISYLSVLGTFMGLAALFFVRHSF
ncbi:MAG: cytochrome c biogenesis protein CcsA [Aquificae bacterium]|nr:cytochrome c biogenesis protein CcsA [Aquificota bacterium]